MFPFVLHIIDKGNTAACTDYHCIHVKLIRAGIDFLNDVDGFVILEPGLDAHPYTSVTRVSFTYVGQPSPVDTVKRVRKAHSTLS